MILLFDSPMNYPQVFCKTESGTDLEFKSTHLKTDQMAIESIFLIMLHQFHFNVNMFRQHNFGKWTISCHIDLTMINDVVYNEMKKLYGDVLYFHGSGMPISKGFNPYWRC